MYVANQIFLTKGVGQHKEKLVSFEMALRDAKLSAFNIVRVSSIVPPGCTIIPADKGLASLLPGQIVHAVIAELSSDEPHRLMAASVGMAMPKNKDNFGYLSEHHSFGSDEKDTGEYAEDLAAQMLATALGIDFDTSMTYIERHDHWKLSGEIVTTRNITQTSICRKGQWTTVLAAAVLVPPGKTP